MEQAPDTFSDDCKVTWQSDPSIEIDTMVAAFLEPLRHGAALINEDMAYSVVRSHMVGGVRVLDEIMVYEVSLCVRASEPTT